MQETRKYKSCDYAKIKRGCYRCNLTMQYCSRSYSPGASPLKMLFRLLAELNGKFVFDFVKHIVRECEMSGTPQVKVVSMILQSFA